MKSVLDAAREIAGDWADFMDLDPNLFSVQLWNDSDLPEDAAERPEAPDAWAATIGKEDNSEFIIMLRPDTPRHRLEHIVLHELVHVYSFAQVGNDDRANMELLTDQCALLLQKCRNSEMLVNGLIKGLKMEQRDRTVLPLQEAQA